MFLRKTFLAALALVAGLGAPAFGREAVVALSPYEDPARQMEIVKAVSQHLAEVVGPGETARVIDGANLALIATFSVPADIEDKTPVGKMRANRTYFHDIKAFVDASSPDGQPGRLDLPGLLRMVGASWPARDGAELLILGSPIHRDDRVPAFSMAGGRVPNDGMIATDRVRSPYGAAGEAGRLAGYRAYFGVTVRDWALSDQFADFVERYVALSISARGGDLAAFDGDLDLLLEKARRGAGVTVPRRLDEKEEPKMIVFSAATTPVLPIFERALSNDPLPTGELREAENVELGLSWACDCDFDLHAKPGPTARVIYYGDQQTPEGRLLKDYTHSPETGWETIVFSRPVDLTQLRVAVDFFRGAGDARAEFRISVGGRTWASTVVIPARQGNAGRGREAVFAGGATPAGWALVNPAQVVGGR